MSQTLTDDRTDTGSSGGTIDMSAMKRFYDAFAKGEAPSTLPPKLQGGTDGPKGGSAGGAMAEVLETLHNELLQVDKVVLDAAKPTKPATLQGKFAYAESVLKSTEKRVNALSTEQVSGAKVTKTTVLAKVESVRNRLEAAKTTQIDRSLALVTEAANGIGSKTTEHAKQAVVAQKTTGEAQKTAKAELFKAASPVQTEAALAVADWTGHVKEAKPFILAKWTDFNKQIARLAKSESDLGRILEFSLPEPKGRPLGPNDPKPEIATAQVEAIDDPAVAIKACGYNWVEAKSRYGADKTVMQKLADYRKKIVDDWLVANLGGYGLALGSGTGWVSVGSADPTSDYDISINKHGTVDGKPESKIKFDYEMVKEFNAWFRGAFGAEAGTVFDTNLYASAPPLVTDKNPDAAPVNDVAALMKMRRYMSPGEFEDFRVETMNACGDNIDEQMKIGKQFAMADNNYRMVIATLLENAAKQLAKRIEEREKAGVNPEDKAAVKQHEEETHLHDEATEWLKQGATVKGIAAYALIEEGEELSHEIDHHLKDASLLTTNEVYADKIAGVRDQEQVAKLLSDMNAVIAKTASGDMGQLVGGLTTARDGLKALKVESKAIDGLIKLLDVREGTPPDPGKIADAVKNLTAQLQRELGDQMQKLGDLSTIARYFANEAYQSDGPFAHVVTATQAAEADATDGVVKETAGSLPESDRKDDQGKPRDPKTLVAMGLAGGAEAFKGKPESEQKELLAAAQKRIDDAVTELKTERQKGMPPEQCLQSFNEQLGDFLKDLEHYGDKEPGVAIIQSSKYLDRLQDAARLMKDKNLFANADKLLEEVNVELALQKDVKGKLIAARKGNLMMVPLEGTAPVDQAEERRAFACAFMKPLGVRSVAELAKRYRSFGIKVNAAARKALASLPPS